jgi:putative proteasome-type protease
MTYCVGLLVREGLVMIADTRTNAGVDNISVYRKLHLVNKPGERVLAIATAGNLSVTQTALSLVQQGFRVHDDDEPETLESAPTMLRAAQILGAAVNSVRREVAPSLQAESVKADATVLLGGQIKGGPMALYMIYGAGNFIECLPDTPYLQVGELKYGKPILDRVLTYGTDMKEAMKLGLISFDSTIRSNLAVGMPLDLIALPRDEVELSVERRLERDDPYFRELGQKWSDALCDAYHMMPAPPWDV